MTWLITIIIVVVIIIIINDYTSNYHAFFKPYCKKHSIIPSFSQPYLPACLLARYKCLEVISSLFSNEEGSLPYLVTCMTTIDNLCTYMGSKVGDAIIHHLSAMYPKEPDKQTYTIWCTAIHTLWTRNTDCYQSYYSFTCPLFNKTITSSDCVPSKGRVSEKLC